MSSRLEFIYTLTYGMPEKHRCMDRLGVDLEAIGPYVLPLDIGVPL